MKEKLQTITDFKLMEVEEAMRALGFTWDETETQYTNLTCSCGEPLQCYGFFGTENISCPKCNKYVQDMTAPTRVSNATVGMVDTDKYKIEGNKFWIAVDGKGGIKLEK